MSDRIVRVRARIQLLSTQEGGRGSPLTNQGESPFSYRPNHNFVDPDNREFGLGFINIEPGTVVRPGESANVEMNLIPWPRDTDLSPGREWRIQEGSQLVGIGKILQVLSDTDES